MDKPIAILEKHIHTQHLLFKQKTILILIILDNYKYSTISSRAIYVIHMKYYLVGHLQIRMTLG